MDPFVVLECGKHGERHPHCETAAFQIFTPDNSQPSTANNARTERKLQYKTYHFVEEL